jgi:hypothetical protein
MLDIALLYADNFNDISIYCWTLGIIHFTLLGLDGLGSTTPRSQNCLFELTDPESMIDPDNEIDQC